MANKLRKTSIAALSVALAVSEREVQLLPAGEFRSTDGSGRPADVAAWRLDAASAARLIARMSAKANPLVIDYEHQTLNKEKNGQPAPAAGWFVGSALEWRDGEGLFALNPDWKARAIEYIAAGEYKFISPVFEYDLATGEVLDIQMAALTNRAGLEGMAAVALTALNDLPTKEASMPELLKKLLAALGLAETASEADALSALDVLQKKADQCDAKTAEVAAMTAQKPNPAEFAPVAAMQALQTQVAALTADLNGGKVAKVVDDALAAGKLHPAQKEWAIDLGRSNFSALTSFVEKTPAIAPLVGTQTGGTPPAGAGGTGTVALTAEQAEVAKALGLSVAQFAAGKLEV